MSRKLVNIKFSANFGVDRYNGLMAYVRCGGASILEHLARLFKKSGSYTIGIQTAALVPEVLTYIECGGDCCVSAL
jgi:hypothetical protein